jgi:hypothetical protein
MQDAKSSSEATSEQRCTSGKDIHCCLAGWKNPEKEKQ